MIHIEKDYKMEMQYQYVLRERHVSHPRDYFSGQIRLDGRWRDVKFVVFTKEEEQLASDIFIHTSKVSHLGIVRPWFYTEAQVEGVSSFLVCYDDFSCTMEDGLKSENKIEPFNFKKERVMDPWWSKAIILLLEAVHCMHRNNLLHMGLELDGTFVIADGLIKILNIPSGVTVQCLRNNADRFSLEKQDMLDLRQKLKHWLSDIPYWSDCRWNVAIARERDLFLQYFDDYDKDGEVYKKLLKHPFLRGSTDRFALCFEMMRLNTSQIPAEQQIWQTFACGMRQMHHYNGWRSYPRSRDLNNVYTYNKARYYDGPLELLRFLRNVHAYARAPPKIEEYEKEVIMLYPGFFTEAYQAYPQLGTALL